jgi:hypothetical protein
MTLQEKEALINENLQQINPRYAIVNLRLTDVETGRYDFDLVTLWKKKDEEAVHQVFRRVLGSHPGALPRTVKTSMVLPEPVYERLQSLKRTRGQSQSEIVAELIRNA